MIPWIVSLVIAIAPHPHHRTLQAHATSQAAVVRSLRHGIAWARGRAWHWQTVAGVAQSPEVRGVGRYHSPDYLRWVEGRWNRRRLRAYRLAHRSRLGTWHQDGSVQAVICQVFGPYCSQALAVTRCESGFSTTAVNGQYLGLFQLGSYERARFATIGYSTAYEQSEAAYRYFVASGRDWSPWTCKP